MFLFRCFAICISASSDVTEQSLARGDTRRKIRLIHHASVLNKFRICTAVQHEFGIDALQVLALSATGHN